MQPDSGGALAEPPAAVSPLPPPDVLRPLENAENRRASVGEDAQLSEVANTVGEDAQVANVDLQNMLQQREQVLRQMSDTGKAMHDGAMAVIRKIGS